MLNQSPVAAMICGPLGSDWPIVYCNAAYEDLTGFSRADVMGRGVQSLRADQSSEHGRVDRALARAQDISLIISTRKKSGDDLRGLLHLSHLRDTDGELVGLLGCLFDLAEPGDMSLARGYGDLVIELKQQIAQPHPTASPADRNPEYALRRIS